MTATTRVRQRAVGAERFTNLGELVKFAAEAQDAIAAHPSSVA